MTADLPEWAKDHAYMMHLLEQAKQLKREGEDLDIVMTITGNSPPTLMNLNPYWAPEYDRSAVLESLGGMLGFGLDAQAIYVVTEAWVSYLPAEDMSKEEAMAYVDSKDYVRPKDDPKRTEAIMVHELQKTGEQYCILCPFEKTDTGYTFHRQPKMMEDHVDYTFKHFFIGVKKGEQAVERFLRLAKTTADYVFPDTGKTAIQHARAGAVSAAKNTFHIDLQEVSADAPSD